MNFLAHAVLAGTHSEVVAGSIAGDFVKGVLYDHQYPADFLFGVRLHRRLDAFSNQQIHLRASADRLPKDLRRIGPPCIDMMADHFLARAAAQNPQDFLPTIIHSANTPNSPDTAPEVRTGATTLLEYEEVLHRLLARHWSHLSPQAKRFFTHAKSTRLFSSYADFSRVSRGISYVCERLGRKSDAPAVLGAIETQLQALEADFADYWPALVAEAARYRDARGEAAEDRLA